MGIEVFTGDDNIPYIKPSRLEGIAKWKDIQDLINRWARRNPIRARELEQAIIDKRLELRVTKNASGKWKQEFSGEYGHISADTRIGLMIDPELLNYIQIFYPKFLSTKDELHEFQRRFPKFWTGEKV